MDLLANISDFMRYNITYVFVGVCLFLLFSPKLRVIAFIILMASIVNISLEPLVVALGRIQTETGQVNYTLYYILSLIDLATAAAVGLCLWEQIVESFLASHIGAPSTKNKVTQRIYESIVVVLMLGSLTNGTIIVELRGVVYSNYTEIIFVLGIVQMLILLIGGTLDAIRCITGILANLAWHSNRPANPVSVNTIRVHGARDMDGMEKTREKLQ